MKMHKLLPSEYNFFPVTYCLPNSFYDLVRDVKKKKYSQTFIVKPDDKSKGGEIFLTKDPDVINSHDVFVV